MNILVVLGHPQPGSFNHAIAEAAVSVLKNNGHEVIFHDLCRERFDPALPDGEIPTDGEVAPVVQEHCRELSKADGIVVYETVGHSRKRASVVPSPASPASPASPDAG